MNSKINLKIMLVIFGITSMISFRIELINAQQINFANTYLQFGKHQAFNFVQLPDSGYILVGSSRVTNSLPQYSFAMRINKYGDTLWTRTYAIYDEIRGIALIDDTTCMVTGGFYKSGGSAITIAKINLNGDTIFRKEFGYPSTGSSIDIYKTKDGGYILNNNVSLDYGFIKLDSATNVQWHTYQNIQTGCTEIKPDIDNGYIAVGGRYDSLMPYKVARLDSAGGIIWIYNYGNGPVPTIDDNSATDVIIMNDSNYLVGTNGSDWQLMKIDRNTGDTLWTKNYDTSYYYFKYWVICMDNGWNNNYILGTLNYMMLVDGNGDTIWKKSNPFPYGFISFDTHKTSDGGYAFCGTVTNGGLGGYQAIGFVKLDSLGNTVFTSVFDPANNYQPLTIYPNPATDKLYINAGNMLNEKNLLFTLTDMQGRSVLNEQYINSPLPGRGVGGEAIDVSTLPNGIYIATLKGKEKEVRGKVIIQR